nr:MAG TPA: hypothetical protein [Caudoviricetes sp.]
MFFYRGFSVLSAVFLLFQGGLHMPAEKYLITG